MDPVSAAPTRAASSPEAEPEITLHAATRQRLHSSIRREATIKRSHNPGAPPPNRKRISPPTSAVLKIPHLFPAVKPEREGTKNSLELILRHPVEFTLEHTGSSLRRKPDIWICRWIAVHVQTDRQAKPWVTLQLEARVGKPGRCDHLRLLIGDQPFGLATDAAEGRGASAIREAGDTLIRERFSFTHEDFRYLCGELTLKDGFQITVDGIEHPIDPGTCAEFREYTLEFFEALRREFPIFFR
jgi:hypothetical protein